MASTAAPSELRGGLRGRASRGRGHGRAKSQTASVKEEPAVSLGPEAALRSKYGNKLALAKELFPDWSDEDLLATIDEAHGDLDTAVNRISEGHAQQWASSTKARKPKTQVTSPPPAATTERGSTRGSVRGAERGTTRGGRGGGRGGRGGRGSFDRGRGGSHTNGITSNGYGAAHEDTTSSFTPAAFSDAPANESSWAETVETPASSTDAEGWGDSTAPSTTAEAGGEWGDNNKTTTADSGWGANEASAIPKQKPAAVALNKGKAPAKSAGRTIQPGTKFSWAQIARPASPPKPVTPSAETRPETPPPAVAVESQEEPQAITIPNDEQLQAAVTAQNHDPWASTPAAATEPWESRPLAGVGEGWAETVLAADNERNVDRSAIPQAGVDPAGPIELSTAPPQQEAPQSAITANLEAQAAQQQPQKGAIGPPGLAKRQSQRGDAAVVIGNDARSAGQVDPAALQFGSLNLYEGAPATEAARPMDVAQAQQHSAYAQTAAQQIMAPEQRPYDQDKSAAPPSQPQQQQYGGYQPFGGYQDPRSAYASSPYAPAGTDSASYYGQQQQQGHAQQQQSAPGQGAQQQPTQYAAPSPAQQGQQYQPFGTAPTPTDYSALGQQQHTPAPEAQRAQQQQQQPSYDYYAQYQQQAGYPRSALPDDASKQQSGCPAVAPSQPSVPQNPYGAAQAAQSQYAQYYMQYNPALYGSAYGAQGNAYGAQAYYSGQQNPQSAYAQSGYPTQSYPSYPYGGFNGQAGQQRALYGAPGYPAAGRGAVGTPQQSYSPYGAPGGSYPGQPPQQQASAQAPGMQSRPEAQPASYKDFSY